MSLHPCKPLPILGNKYISGCSWSCLFHFGGILPGTRRFRVSDFSPPFPLHDLYPLPLFYRNLASHPFLFLRKSVNVVREAVKGLWLTQPYLLLVTATRRVHGLDDIDGISNEERIECCSRHHTGYGDASLRNVLWWMQSITNT